MGYVNHISFDYTAIMHCAHNSYILRTFVLFTISSHIICEFYFMWFNILYNNFNLINKACFILSSQINSYIVFTSFISFPCVVCISIITFI